MAKEKGLPELTNDQATVGLYREFLKVVDPKDLKIAEALQGDEHRDFCKFAHETFHNPFFDKIVKGFIFASVMLTAEKGITADHYWNSKLTINGIKSMEEYFARYASIYEAQYLSKEPDFDKNASFSPAKV